MTTSPRRTAEPPTMPRLFAAQDPGLTEHHLRFGTLPDAAGEELIASLDQAGLSGRGGAGFATGRKIASVTGRRPVVVANGAEGEPLSRKDAVLLTRAPHLVLDGLDAAAGAVGADKVYLYVPAHIVPAVSLRPRRATGGRARSAQGHCGRGSRHLRRGGGVRGRQANRGRPGAAARPHGHHRDIGGAGTAHAGQQRRNPGSYRVDRPVRTPLVSIGGRSGRPRQHACHPVRCGQQPPCHRSAYGRDC